METFVDKHAAKLRGTLSCFDRVLFRGYLPLMSGWAMAEFLKSKRIDRWKLKPFVLEQAERIKKRAGIMASQARRPYQYLSEPTRQEDLARKIAERDGIREGFVCVFSVVEPCRTFSLGSKEGKAWIRPAKRKCLQLYYYFMDGQLGLIHVKIQSWFPFPIQVYVNGHEWLVDVGNDLQRSKAPFGRMAAWRIRKLANVEAAITALATGSRIQRHCQAQLMEPASFRP